MHYLGLKMLQDLMFFIFYYASFLILGSNVCNNFTIVTKSQSEMEQQLKINTRSRGVQKCPPPSTYFSQVAGEPFATGKCNLAKFEKIMRTLIGEDF